MAGWDENSPELSANLDRLRRRIHDQARRREPLSVETIRDWHIDMMRGLVADEPVFVGRYRGESGLEDVEVMIGDRFGVAPEDVTRELARFETVLRQAIASLDAAVPAGTALNDDAKNAIVSVCGWAHAEWVRIHPFANGNGRSARLLANAIAVGYGLPPFVRLRPRPGGD